MPPQRQQQQHRPPLGDRPYEDRARRPQKEPAAPKAQTSLSLSNASLPSPLPSLDAYASLNRLDLSKLKGGLDGVGAGWIGDNFGKQLTWLNLSFCPGAAHSWKGFDKLTGLVVLNVSSCDLSSLPAEFASLVSLKAFVATHNALESFPENIPESCTLVNSIILSHNPLKSLPSNLSSLSQLNKLSLSNTSITSKAFPDLSSLPHLRMLSLSHTPLLASLPEHFRTWGTGLLPPSEGTRFDRPNNRAAAGEGRRGDGLEVVELGGSGMTWDGLRNGVGKGMPGLRSLGLRGSPVTEMEEYKESVLALLPTLQILDNSRLVERKRKGPSLVQPLTSFQASKVPGKEEIDAEEVARRAEERGVALQGRKREWGVKKSVPDEQEDEEEGEEDEEDESVRLRRTRRAIDQAKQAEQEQQRAQDSVDDGMKRKRKSHAKSSTTTTNVPTTKVVEEEEETVDAIPTAEQKKLRKRKPHSAAKEDPSNKKDSAQWRAKQAAKPVEQPAPTSINDAGPSTGGGEPSAAVDGTPAEKGKRKRKARGGEVSTDASAPAEKSSVLKVVEVKPAKGGRKKAKNAGGVDLEGLYGKKKESKAGAGEDVEMASEGGGAFGTGGWDD